MTFTRSKQIIDKNGQYRLSQHQKLTEVHVGLIAKVLSDLDQKVQNMENNASVKHTASDEDACHKIYISD